MEFLRPWLATLKANTRLPVDAALGESAEPRDAHQPGAGWVIGAAACLAFAVVGLLLRASALTPLAAAIGCTMATALLTGARDEKQLRDAFAGSGDIALMLALAMKAALLAVIAGQSEPGVLVALFAAQVLSRGAPLIADRKLAGRDLGIAIAWCVPPVLLAFAARGLAFAIVPLVFVATAAWASRRTDARQQPCELAFYFGAAISA